MFQSIRRAWRRRFETPATLHPVQEFLHDQNIRAVAINPNGTEVAFGDNHKSPTVLTLGDPWSVRRTEHTPGTWSRTLAYTPDGQTLIATGKAESRSPLRFWPDAADDHEPTLTLTGSEASAFHTSAALPDIYPEEPAEDPDAVILYQIAMDKYGGRVVGTMASSHRWQIWDLEQRARLLKAELPMFDEIKDVAWQPDSETVAFATSDAVILCDATSGEMLGSLRAEGSTGLAFSPDGRYLAAVYTNGTVRIWDMKTSKVCSQNDHEKSGKCVAFGPDGKRVAVGRSGGLVQIVDLDGITTHVLDGLNHSPYAISLGKEYVAAGGGERKLVLWKV